MLKFSSISQSAATPTEVVAMAIPYNMPIPYNMKAVVFSNA